MFTNFLKASVYKQNFIKEVRLIRYFCGVFEITNKVGGRKWHVFSKLRSCLLTRKLINGCAASAAFDNAIDFLHIRKTGNQTV